MAQPLHIIKIGGKIVSDPERLNTILKSIADSNAKTILVHGGGNLASKMADKMQIPQKMINGRRITDADTLQLITMVYGGEINRNMVAKLVNYGKTAIGLSGADANTVISKKRPPQPIDFGFVGDVIKVNVDAISKLLDTGFTPVFCAITHDNNGQLLNTNADTMASVIATNLSKTYNCKLTYCFEKKGVLKEVDDESSVIKELHGESYEKLKADGKIFEGMIPKLDNAFNALEGGVAEVFITKAEDFPKLILSDKNHGTRITK